MLKTEIGLERGFDTYIDSFRKDWFRTAGEINEEVEKYLKTRPEGRHFLWIHYSDQHEHYQDPDSGEHVNIVSERPRDASRLAQELDYLLEGVKKPEGKRAPLDEDTRNKLRALGYAD